LHGRGEREYAGEIVDRGDAVRASNLCERKAD
jgi:hypothetical protein